MAKRKGRYNDWGKTYKAFSYAFLNAGRVIAEDTKLDLTVVGEKFLAKVDSEWPHSSTAMSSGGKVMRFGGDREHPWYTGQLHDSLAVRIAYKNKTVSVRYMPPSPDTGKAQHTEQINNIIGAEWAHEVAERRAPWYFLPGLQMQLIVGVPYADKVNESSRHLGFADDLASELINHIDTYIAEGGFAKREYFADDKVVKHKRVR